MREVKVLLLWPACVLAVDQEFLVEEPVDRIVVDIAAGDLQVRAKEGPVRIAGDFGGAGGGPIEADLEGTELVVSFDCEFCAGTLTVWAPPATALDLRLAAGDLDVDDMSGPLTARLVAGSAEVADHGPGPAVLDVDLGDLEASFVGVPEDLEATVGGGNVEVGVPAGPYALELSAFGGIDVRNVEDDPLSPHRIALTATAGSIGLTGY